MKKNNIIVFIIIGLLLIGTGLGIYYSSGAGQSVLSVSSINVGNDGKVYWTFFASANKPNEQYIFTSKPSTYTKTDGTQITPQSNLLLVISPKEPQCIYQATEVTKKYNLGLSTLKYWTLKNPEKKIEIEIVDGNNVLKKMDGTIIDSLTIQDTDGKGSVIIETQGLLSGKYNCPNYDNTALYVAKDGTYGFFYRDDIDRLANFLTIALPGDSTISKFKSINNLVYNTGFTSSFSNLPLWNGNDIIGNINFGYPTFTITADQDYFDSVVYLPPKKADPKIVDVSYASEVKVGDTSSIKLTLKNKENNEGLVVVKASSKIGSISPTSTNLKIGNYNTDTFFTLKVPSSETCGLISFEVCGVDQFSSFNCDTKSINVCSVNENVEKCGDGICQLYESYATCPNDCQIGKEICGNGIDDDRDGLIDSDDPDCQINNECGAWISLFGKTIIPDLFCIINNFIQKLKINFASIVGILGGLLGALYMRKPLENNKNKWIVLGLTAIVLGLTIGYLAYLFFWWILLTLSILALIKAFIPGI